MERGILVIGSLNTDMVVVAPRFPEPGENVHGSDFSMVAGGKGANQAVAVHRLGLPTALLSCVGSDVFGDFLCERLRSCGVDDSLVKRSREVGTGVALIVVEEGTGNNTIVVDPGSNYALAPSDLDALDGHYPEHAAALFQLEVPLDVVVEGARRARENGLLTILDAGPPRHDRLDVVEHFDVVSPNRAELAALTGEDVGDRRSVARACGPLLQRGVEAVVVKMGDEGALLATSEGAWQFDPFDVEAVDSTGAGDAFTAGLACALVEGREPPEAVLFANAAGAAAVRVLGAQPSMPSRSDVDSLLDEQSPGVRRL
ncbi:MAG: ribokinase [Actinobacteria bacterium]|nr:ribokinase [Actinomycetota bacterium]MBU1943801.1 ribokinase [Actinomycetota bacterium]MBU2689038.1 ribokinase [Actinomycetota bacterium]